MNEHAIRIEIHRILDSHDALLAAVHDGQSALQRAFAAHDAMLVSAIEANRAALRLLNRIMDEGVQPMSPNNSRRFSGGGRPDWPKFQIRDIPPALWEAVKARAVRESADGSPRINAICLKLLHLYATVGLPEVPAPPVE